MILNSFTKENLIDLNTAKDNLVQLLLRVGKGEEVKDLMGEYISSFFTYSYLQKEKEGKSLDGLTYHQVNRRDIDAIGYSMRNNVYINERIYSKMFKPTDSGALIDTIFHETQHCSDDMNPTKTNSANYTPYFAGGLSYKMFDELAEMFETSDSFSFLQNLDDSLIDAITKNIYDHSFGVYLNSPNEKRARDFAKNSTLDIIEHGLNSNLGFYDKMLLKKISKSYNNLTSKINNQEKKLTKIKLDDLSETTMAMLQVHLYSQLMDLNEQKSLFDKDKD